mmetsp:Transcript_11306/g.30092  ORF Transcript_11306/g.30092 Transcript_11306/m.30092 type:complete len:400 (+) Transcript_11306:94-1293(+)
MKRRAALASACSALWLGAAAAEPPRDLAQREANASFSSGFLAKGPPAHAPAVAYPPRLWEPSRAAAALGGTDAQLRGRGDAAASALQLDAAARKGSQSRGGLQTIPTPFPMKSVRHRKEAGDSYLEGSPLYPRQQQRVDATAAQASPQLPERSELGRAAAFSEPPLLSHGLSASSPWGRVTALLLAHVMFALLVVMWAYLYRAHGKGRYTRSVQARHGDSFTFGLFEVGNLNQDWPICFLAFCCPAIRWADTMTKARLLPFWMALGLMIVLSLLGPITYGVIFLLIVLVGVYFRQRLRKLYNHGPFKASVMAWDCLTWCFCVPCAVVQEAREVEKVQREPSPPLQQHVQLPRGAAPPPQPAAAAQQRLQAWQTGNATHAALPGSDTSLRLASGRPAAQG